MKKLFIILIILSGLCLVVSCRKKQTTACPLCGRPYIVTPRPQIPDYASDASMEGYEERQNK